MRIILQKMYLPLLRPHLSRSVRQPAREGNLTFRSGVTTVAKEGIAMMAGAGALDVTMRVNGSRTASVVAGMIASGAAGRGWKKTFIII